MAVLAIVVLLSVYFLVVTSQKSIPPWPNSIFYKDITTDPLDTSSAAIIANMKASSAGGSTSQRTNGELS